jgi:hypothetical protein
MQAKRTVRTIERFRRKIRWRGKEEGDLDQRRNIGMRLFVKEIIKAALKELRYGIKRNVMSSPPTMAPVLSRA